MSLAADVGDSSIARSICLERLSMLLGDLAKTLSFQRTTRLGKEPLLSYTVIHPVCGIEHLSLLTLKEVLLGFRGSRIRAIHSRAPLAPREAVAEATAEVRAGGIEAVGIGRFLWVRVSIPVSPQ